MASALVMRVRTWRWSSLLAVVAVGAWPAWAGPVSHTDVAGPVVLGLAVFLVSAKLGADVAVRLGQPAVLGELVAGVVLGNLSLVGVSWVEPLRSDVYLDMFARVGVIILLFEVGLESTVGQMLKVGVRALLVATIGVLVPFALGFGVAHLLLPQSSVYVHLFIGATLTATSVGITARVLRDLEQMQRPEARIILGAAVIDDVLGLVILALVTGVIAAADSGGSIAVSEVLLTLGKALAFLVGALALGRFVSTRLFAFASLLRARMVLLAFSLAFCFGLSFVADAIGLAPIVGAFAAGLILEAVQYRDLQAREEQTLEQLVHPISSFLVPVFFVLMGMRTALRELVQPQALGLAVALCVVAVLGKLVAGVGAGGSVNRLSVGLGMIPRGEVGLIFASIGASLSVQGQRVVSEAVFSAVVTMVMVTTMVTPPLLRWQLKRSG